MTINDTESVKAYYTAGHNKQEVDLIVGERYKIVFENGKTIKDKKE